MEQGLITRVAKPVNLWNTDEYHAPPRPSSHQPLSPNKKYLRHKTSGQDLAGRCDPVIEGYYQVDLAGNITGFDQRMLDILGYRTETLMGIGHRALMDSATAGIAFKAFHQVYLTNKSTKGHRWKLIREDGSTRNVKVSVTLIHDNNGIPQGFVGSVQDQMEHRQMTEGFNENIKPISDGERRCKEMQTALRVLMKNQEDLQEELAERMLTQVKTTVLPHIEWLLGKKLSSNARARVLLVQSNLKNLMSPFARKMTSAYYNLTRTELEVADLVRYGRSNKEIAAILGLSLKTVETHRNKIRRKLGINHTKTNLHNYLQTLAD